MMQQNLQSISLKTASPIEGHDVAVLTPHAFSKLHMQSLHLEGSIFLVRQHTKEADGCSITWKYGTKGRSSFLVAHVRVLWDPMPACLMPSAACSQHWTISRPVPSCAAAQDSATAFQLLERIAIHGLSAGEWSNKISWAGGSRNTGGVWPADQDQAATVLFGFETHRQRLHYFFLFTMSSFFYVFSFFFILNTFLKFLIHFQFFMILITSSSLCHLRMWAPLPY